MSQGLVIFLLVLSVHYTDCVLHVYIDSNTGGICNKTAVQNMTCPSIAQYVKEYNGNFSSVTIHVSGHVQIAG